MFIILLFFRLFYKTTLPVVLEVQKVALLSETPRNKNVYGKNQVDVLNK